MRPAEFIIVGVLLLATFLFYRLLSASKVVLDEVHELCNSNLSRVLADLELANDRIGKLETLIATQGSAREKAQADMPHVRSRRKDQ